MPRRDQRSRLLYVLAQHLAQSGMQQMGCGVITHRGFADFGVHDGIQLISDANRSLGKYLMRTYALNGVVAASYLSDDSIVIVCVKPAAVAHLSASFGVEGS